MVASEKLSWTYAEIMSMEWDEFAEWFEAFMELKEEEAVVQKAYMDKELKKRKK